MAKFYPAGGGGSGGWDDVGDIPSDGMPIIVVANAGTTGVNGNFNEVLSNFGGKPRYSTTDGTASVYWVGDSSYWAIALGGDEEYRSLDDVATPDLVTTWTVSAGELPLPTVTAGTADYTDDYAIYADGSGFAEWRKLFPYVVYTALLTQTTTDGSAPTATILQSTFPFNPTFVYDSPGLYVIQHSMITTSNTFFSVPAVGIGSNETPIWTLNSVGVGEIYLLVYSEPTLENNVDLFLNLPIEIRIYPG